MKKNKSNLKRFLKYFKPVMGYFLLDSFFAIILAGSSIALPFVTQYIFSAAQFAQYKDLALGVGFVVSLLLVRLFATFIVTKWGHMMGVRMEINMRNDAIKKLHSLPTSHFDKTPTGTYISRIVTDLKDIPEFAHHGPEDLIMAVLLSAGGFTYTFLQSWILGVSLMAMFIVGFTIILLIRSKWRKIWTSIREWNSDMSASVGFQVEGMSEIKSYNSEKFEHKRFQKYQAGYKKAWFRFFTFEAFFTNINILVMSLTTTGTIIIGAYLVADGSISFAQLMGLIVASGTLTQPIQKFVNVYTMISRGSSSVDRFMELMDTPEEDNSGKISPKTFKGEIEFKNVWFSYIDNAGELVEVFKGLNLKFGAGEKVAIIGETGIGKSTILKLLMKYYKIQKGEILIDGVNIDKYHNEEYRKRVGYIQQQTTLFNDTVKNNILYGNPKATDAQVMKAAKEASIIDFIDKLPNKYETEIGPRGSKLSGGQKQRISIARAFLGRSDFMLLDEATSSLDNDTELKIKKAVAKLTKNKTTITVAHRLSTIKESDKIVVLGRHGKIIQEGTHNELMSKPGYYNDINM